MFFSINQTRRICLDCAKPIFKGELILESEDLGPTRNFMCESCLKRNLNEVGYDLINKQLRKDAKAFM